MVRPQLTLFADLEAAPSLREIADAVREAGISSLPDARRRADEARYQEVDVRSALTKVSGMPFAWALNPYRGCTHACEYCYARKYQRYLELDTGDEFSSFILVKRNLPQVLARELARASWQREGVAIGTATDAYQPIEGHYKLTRRCIDVLTQANTPFSIVTKGPMILRDRDLLQRAAAGAGCRVLFSVPTVDERAWSALEPGTASPRQRLRAAAELRREGIDTGVLMMPLVAGFSTSADAIERTVRAIVEAGVPLVGANIARLDPGVREHFFAFLERSHPELVEGYRRLYASGTRVEAGFGAEVRRVVHATQAAIRAESREAPGSEPLSADASKRDPEDRPPKTAS